MCTTSVVLDTDRTVLAVVLRNLFGNAVAYAPAGGRLWCEAQVVGERCTLSVLNSNNSLTERDVPLLTEPFWRKDASRGTSSENAGLGLSLVSAYATMLKGSFSASLRTPDTFAATLELPIARSTIPPTLREPAPAAAVEMANLATANMIAP
jgi:signal transduction histidine kinase